LFGTREGNKKTESCLDPILFEPPTPGVIVEPDAHIGYRNLRIGEFPVEREIKAALEALWARYEPYADANFCQEFSRQPDNRFWEMYLTVRLLDAGKKIRSRAELPSAARDVGLDLCNQKGTRRTWIEAVSPELGHANNPDRLADWPAEEARIDVDEQRHQVELRITTALSSKIKNSKGTETMGSSANGILVSSQFPLAARLASHSRRASAAGHIGLPLWPRAGLFQSECSHLQLGL
jgi:hypothetical protein